MFSRSPRSATACRVGSSRMGSLRFAPSMTQPVGMASRSVATDLLAIPTGWVIDGANRNEPILLEPTLQAVADRGLLLNIETLHLDRGYDSALTTQPCQGLGLTDIVCAKKKRKGEAKIKKPLTPALRRPVERTNSWLSTF